MARPLKPFVRSGGYYPSAKYTPLVYPGGYTTLNAKNGKPEPLNTFVGKIVQFLAKRSLPMVKLEANFTPIQNLNGQEAPYPPGGGKNKLPITATTSTVSGVTFTVNDDGTISTSGTATADINKVINQTTKLVSGESYKLAGCESGGDGSNYYMRSTRGITVSSTGPYFSKKATATDEALYLFIHISNGVNTNGFVFKPMICLSTETDYTFAPYSNICPISGHTGCDIFDKAEYDAQATPTVAISFGQTVYGGRLTVFEDGSGQVVADRAMNLINAESTLNINGKIAGVSTEVCYIPSPTKANGEFNFISSVFNVASGTEVGKAIGRTTSGNVFFRVPDSVTTVAEAQAWFGNNPTQIAYELAEPITIPVTASQINTLVGENVVWVNDSDNIQVTAYGTPIT